MSPLTFTVLMLSEPDDLVMPMSNSAWWLNAQRSVLILSLISASAFA